VAYACGRTQRTACAGSEVNSRARARARVYRLLKSAGTALARRSQIALWRYYRNGESLTTPTARLHARSTLRAFPTPPADNPEIPSFIPRARLRRVLAVLLLKRRGKRPRDFAFLALSLSSLRVISLTRYIITRTSIVLATRDFTELIYHRDSAEPERESWRNPLAESERERERGRESES